MEDLEASAVAPAACSFQVVQALYSQAESAWASRGVLLRSHQLRPLGAVPAAWQPRRSHPCHLEHVGLPLRPRDTGSPALSMAIIVWPLVTQAATYELCRSTLPRVPHWQLRWCAPNMVTTAMDISGSLRPPGGELIDQRLAPRGHP